MAVSRGTGPRDEAPLSLGPWLMTRLKTPGRHLRSPFPTSPPNPSRHLHLRRTAGAVQVSSPVGLSAGRARACAGSWRSPTGVLREGAGGEVYEADPIFGKSNLIFTLAAADGLLRIPPDATGLSAGEMVEVVLL